MSRVGKKPITLPDNVKVAINGREIVVEAGGKKLAITHRREVTVRVDDQLKAVVVERDSDDRISRAMHGLTRALIANMVQGVTGGFRKELEINGVGWNGQVQGRKIVLNIGYAAPRTVGIPDGVEVEVRGLRVVVSGSDKQKVGQLAAVIRSQRKPEPYNGKGIKYVDEQIVRKAGKQFVGGGA